MSKGKKKGLEIEGDGKPKKAKKEPKETHTTITCMDCGAERRVKVQDKFQVKRCINCQTLYKKAMRKEYRRNRIRKLREENDMLKEALTENGIEIPALA